MKWRGDRAREMAEGYKMLHAGDFQRRGREVGQSERWSDDAVCCGRFQCAHRYG